jgi:sialic acid synthase SpsE
MRIGQTDTTKGQTYIIAELSANHAGKLETAIATVDAVANSGADAIKLQTYLPESLTLDA